MMPFSYNFPATRFVPRKAEPGLVWEAEPGDLWRQVHKVCEEAAEIEGAWRYESEERVIEETLDCMQACETLLRAFSAERVKIARDAVVEKDRKRGYYREEER